VPISYYTDLWLYRRRQASKASQAVAKKAERAGREAAAKEQDAPR
jgi:hypothetical protein